jgi:hypothetical protein
MVVGFTTIYAISTITANVVISNPTQAIQHYVIKFISELRQVGGFLRVLRIWFHPLIKLTAMK